MQLIREMDSYEKTFSPAYVNCLKYYCIFASESGQLNKAKEALKEATLGRFWQWRRRFGLFDDDGPGLPASMHEAVFDAYVRGEDTQQRPGSEASMVRKP
jgi:hypothetical protein